MYGLFYAQPAYFTNSDTWHFFELSKGETDWLLRDPIAFVKDIFSYGYQQSGNLFIGQNSYWNDLKSNIVIKLMAVCNVFTFKNYYANVVFFNFLFFFGPVAFYRLMKGLIANKFILTISIFCIPSFLFWCSGAHKDGLIFSCLGVLMYHINNFIRQKNFFWRPFIICLFCFALMFALRNFMALFFLPALLVWVLCERYPYRKIPVISLVYGFCLMVFFLSPYINKQTNLLQYIVEKQGEFKQLQGSSQIAVPDLQPQALSFIQFLPAAIDIAFFRPHINEMKNLSYLPAIAETILLWVFALFCLIKRKKLPVEYASIIIFCFCFSVSVLLVAGYTNIFSGAIVRYRSLELPLLFVPLTSFLISKKTNYT